MRMATLVMFLLAFVAMPNAVAGRNVSHVERLSHRRECGNVAVRAGGKRLPGDAKISVKRARAENAKRRLVDGLKQRRFGGGKGAARRGGVRLGGGAASKEPKVLAMYDV